MSRMQNRIDVQAEINACERIRAFDETRLNLELSKAGVDPEGLTQRLDGELGITAQASVRVLLREHRELWKIGARGRSRPCLQALRVTCSLQRRA